MRFKSQVGKSFFEALAVFLAVSLVFGFGFSKYTQDRHHQNMLKIVETMHTFFERYQMKAPDIFKQMSPPSGALMINSYNLMDECKEKPSLFNKYKNVCAFGLGEVDVNVTVDHKRVQTDVYVHFFDMYKKHSCRQFLSVGWEKVLPKKWWNQEGYIGVISENTDGKMYFSYNPDYIRNDGAEENPTREHMKAICETCKGSRYCSILFSFTFNEDTLKNVTFPSEFMGESESTDEEEAEISKDGSTYTKESGDKKEVVTFGPKTFSGATYSGGSLTSVYEGTYSPQGITSYTSYSDVARRDIMQKVSNISYDKNGKVQFYEKDAKKILLTGSADDCLIMDDANNARRFGHCSDLFNAEKSSLFLQYDEKGLLREVIVDGKDKKGYTFSYDEYTGELTDYCEAGGKKCHKVRNGRKIKDIVKQDIPETTKKFDSLYAPHNQPITSPQNANRTKHRIMTREEALKRVKDDGNKVKIIIK